MDEVINIDYWLLSKLDCAVYVCICIFKII